MVTARCGPQLDISRVTVGGPPGALDYRALLERMVREQYAALS
jgi:hypothetical protein